MKMAIMNRFDSGLVLDLSCKSVTKQEPTTPPHYYTTPEPMLQYSHELPQSRLQVLIQHSQHNLQYPQQRILVGNLSCHDDDRLHNRAPCYSPPNDQFSYPLEAAIHPMHSNTHNTRTHDDFSETSSTNSGSSSRSPTLYSKSLKESKATRPFKAYLKDPFTMAAGFTSADTMLNDQSANRFSEFRKHMLDQIRRANGGQATVSNPKMRRTVKRTHAESCDNDELRKEGSRDTYIEKRMKNNEAAKKSRDRRRIKEDEIAIRAAFLERENIKLKFELAAARKQLTLYGVAE